MTGEAFFSELASRVVTREPVRKRVASFVSVDLRLLPEVFKGRRIHAARQLATAAGSCWLVDPTGGCRRVVRNDWTEKKRERPHLPLVSRATSSLSRDAQEARLVGGDTAHPAILPGTAETSEQ